jgi:protocatechuate 3,4-dioxygenase beta subunit
MTTMINRRAALHRLGAAAMALPATKFLAACGSSSSASVDAPVLSDGVDASGSQWASGGTAAMTGQSSYPDPFPTTIASCATLQMLTAGPCTTAATMDRQDVSEGQLGLPVRLMLKIVSKTGCNPVGLARVEIWHTNKSGVYSGVTPNPQLCYGADPSAASKNFFRGSRTTAGDGIVKFDTCFPGWYPGRAIHIHLRIYNGATLSEVSQLFFPEATTTAIFASHPDYKSFGQPNTSLSRDSVAGAIADKSAYIVDVARMADGAMLASKIVSI